jgi:hypothetical protein
LLANIPTQLSLTLPKAVTNVGKKGNLPRGRSFAQIFFMIITIILIKYKHQVTMEMKLQMKALQSTKSSKPGGIRTAPLLFQGGCDASSARACYLMKI